MDINLVVQLPDSLRVGKRHTGKDCQRVVSTTLSELYIHFATGCVCRKLSMIVLPLTLFAVVYIDFSFDRI